MAKKSAAMKRPRKSAVKRPTALKRPAASKKPAAAKKRPVPRAPKELKGMKAFVVNLERRPDRWNRVSKMLRKQMPWLDFEQLKASDGTKNPIPAEEVCETWNTENNANYGDYFMWVIDAPGTPQHGTMWKWAADTPGEDDAEWNYKEDAEEEFMYIRDMPSFPEAPVRMATAEKKATGEKLRLKLVLKKSGDTQKMSGGERGCAHSHLRIWRLAAERQEPTLALEDDVHIAFKRHPGYGKMNGKIFTKRLALAVKQAPSDFDVLYLGWSGWRGGHHNLWKDPYTESPKAKKIIRKAEYIWTTVAYVVSQAGAKKLLNASPLNQPVDNFMAWEASQKRLNSYVVLDEGDRDDTWSGGIVDQYDFQGDSDIQKSDGGVQGDNAADFAVVANA